MNNVNLIGNLTRDPELRYLAGGTAIVEFAIAINKKWKGQNGEAKEKTSFLDCQGWGKSAEVFAQYHKKGQQAAITGHLEQETWEDKQTGKKRSKIKVIMDEFTFVRSRDGGEAEEQPKANPRAKIDPMDVPKAKDADTDDVPF